jgi:class 3 adenylate cyclase
MLGEAAQGSGGEGGTGDHRRRGFQQSGAADRAAGLTRRLLRLNRLRALRREIVEPLAAKNGGRIFKTTGDGLLAEFPSTVQAHSSGAACGLRRAAGEGGAAF